MKLFHITNQNLFIIHLIISQVHLYENLLGGCEMVESQYAHFLPLISHYQISEA